MSAAAPGAPLGSTAAPASGAATGTTPATTDVAATTPQLPTSRPQPPARLTPAPQRLEHGTGTAPFTAILWDLDGTIADSAPGITRAIAKMLDTFGLPVPSQAELLSYVGPPIIDSFKKNGLDNGVELEEAMAMYREIYQAEGELEATPYDGVLDLIRTAHAAGIPQSTATSKNEAAATRILASFGVLDDLEFVTGATEDERRSAKADVVAEALRRLGDAGHNLSNVLMIGDRFYDVQGAAANGVPATYATWGYGTVGEDAGAVTVVTNAVELRTVLGL